MTVWRVLSSEGQEEGSLGRFAGKGSLQMPIGLHVPVGVGKESTLDARSIAVPVLLSLGRGSQGLTCPLSLGLLRQSRFRNTTMPVSPGLEPLKDRHRRFGHDVKLARS